MSLPLQAVKCTSRSRLCHQPLCSAIIHSIRLIRASCATVRAAAKLDEVSRKISVLQSFLEPPAAAKAATKAAEEKAGEHAEVRDKPGCCACSRGSGCGLLPAATQHGRGRRAAIARRGGSIGWQASDFCPLLELREQPRHRWTVLRFHQVW